MNFFCFFFLSDPGGQPWTRTLLLTSLPWEKAAVMLARATLICVKELGEDDPETKASHSARRKRLNPNPKHETPKPTPNPEKAARGSLGELYRRNGKANEGARIACRADVAALSGLD